MGTSQKPREMSLTEMRRRVALEALAAAACRRADAIQSEFIQRHGHPLTRTGPAPARQVDNRLEGYAIHAARKVAIVMAGATSPAAAAQTISVA